ncbi:MAG TPA: TrkA family potassium uptake protein [Firmicutes bacterium]|nr:TrkA family potassium uptake protein [Bacillota bacterium]
MRVVILGCGRLGTKVAQKMAKESGNTVVVIDSDADAFSSLDKEFPGKVSQGDGTDMAAYASFMEEKPDVFLALTDSDNANIMAAEIAKQKYKVDSVIARVHDPIRAKAFEELGIETFCPTMLSEKKIAKMIDARKPKEEGGDE